jgi:ferrous iron transport protein A
VKCEMCGPAAACGGCPIASGFYLPTTLATLQPGERATVEKLVPEQSSDLRKLLGLGLMPGVDVEVERAWPAVVVRMGFQSVALDGALAAGVVVTR